MMHVGVRLVCCRFRLEQEGEETIGMKRRLRTFDSFLLSGTFSLSLSHCRSLSRSLSLTHRHTHTQT